MIKHKLLGTICASALILSGCGSTQNNISTAEHTRYITSGTYYITAEKYDQVLTDDGNLWDYTQTIISGKPAYHNEPVYVVFDDNGTPDNIYDDEILGLVLDKETEIYNKLETALSDAFEVERSNNNIRIGTLKKK